MSIQGKRLCRDTFNGKIAGVCAGLANYFNVDVVAIRIAFVLAIFLMSGGLLAYLICWLLMPNSPDNQLNR